MSNKAQKRGLVPKLRFPEFRDAGEWEISPLSKYVSSLDAGVSVVSGDRPAGCGEVGILKTSAVTNGVFNSQENKIVLDKGELQRVKEPVFANSIIISRMNTPALVGANAYVSDSLENIFLPDRLWAAKPRRNTSMRFLAFVLGSEKGRAALSELATGTSGSMKNITKPDVLALEITAPSFAEQQKIADCLVSLDERITLEAQKLDTLKSHKKGLMQQLFPAEGETLPKLRFPEFRDAGEWDERQLGSVCDVRDGTHDSPKFYSTGKPLLTSKNLLSDGNLDIENVSFISEEDYEQINRRSRVDVGDILFGMIGTIGNPVMVPTDGFAIKNVALIKQQTDLLNCFLVQFLNSNYIASKIDILNTGNSQKFIALGKLRSLDVPVPPKLEQQKIADCLTSLDDLITAQTQKLAALKTHKKGLMQQLFPVLEGEQV